ncbi:TBC1 domain containing protein 2 [Sarcoptes scabiei]|uniref:TBC1 domain containing protein 2 n=1 Tax=Sarcoptes scabiei TaxID=52283 RepID=A0A132A674_SARSC|nr:TBC1 domain containing protein 2 [Sarcoptes scabiei]
MRFNELRIKFSKSDLKSKSIDSDPFMYNPLLDYNHIDINNNCFEVRSIGNFAVSFGNQNCWRRISQKRLTPAVIDRFVDEIRNEMKKCSISNKIKLNGISTEVNISNRAPKFSTAHRSKSDTGCRTNGMKLSKDRSRRQYRKNRFLVQVLEENELDDGENETIVKTNESRDLMNGSAPVNSSDSNSSITKLIDDTFEEEQNDSLRPSNRAQSKTTLLFIIGHIDICLIATENQQTICTKIFANIVDFMQGANHSDYFGIIFREPYVPAMMDSFSPNQNTSDNSIPFTSSLSSTPSQRLSKSISSETKTENFIIQIFQCQSDQIVSDLLNTLRKSLESSIWSNNLKSTRQSNEHLHSQSYDSPSKSSSSSVARSTETTIYKVDSFQSITSLSTYNSPCQNCPMNWFHQLCSDIYGLSDEKIFAMLVYRIKHGSSDRRWKEYTAIFDYLQLEKLEQKVDVLVIMLKARVEKMQRYHEINEGRCRMDELSLNVQIEKHDPAFKLFQQQKSTLSLNRLEGLRLMAKCSLSNTFDAFRKLNRGSQSNDSFAITNLSNEHFSSSNRTEEHLSPTEIEEDNLKKQLHRRNTVADCFREEQSKSYEAALLEPNEMNQPLMDIFIKSSNANSIPVDRLESMEQLRQNLNGSTDSEISLESDSINNFEKVNFPRINSNSSTVQVRHRILRRVRRSLNRIKSEKKNGTQNDSSACSSPPTTGISKAKQLWFFAVRKQIQLLRKERSNSSDKLPAIGIIERVIKKRINESGDSFSKIDDDWLKLSEINHSYEDIPPIKSSSQFEMIVLRWRQLMEKFESLCHNEKMSNDKSESKPDGISLPLDSKYRFENSLLEALRLGVPKEIRSIVWKFFAKYRRSHQPVDQRKFHETSLNTSDRSLYRSLLDQFTLHQHAILVDLGRTFPTVPFFAEPMGIGQLTLYNLLKAYSLLDKDVEYCQGLSFIAGILLLHVMLLNRFNFKGD